MDLGANRFRAVIELAIAQLSHYRTLVFIAVVGIAIAVVLVTSLGGLWHGISTEGTEAIETTNRDLWLSAPVEFAPASVGGVSNQLQDSHLIAKEITTRPNVKEAEALGFQRVYISQDGEEFQTVVGVGITGTSAPIELVRGTGFDQRDLHYADGTYSGPMSHHVIVDERLAQAYDLNVGDSLHIGGTITTAREHQFEVVGISSTFSSFIGTTSIVLHLGELQTITGKTGSDPASLVAITLENNADEQQVIDDLEQAYPEFTVRTNTEQFRAVIGRQAPIVTGTAVIGVTGILVGIFLVVNTMMQLVYAQRAELAALKAGGVSTRTLSSVTLVQGIVIGLIGAVLGLVSTSIVSWLLNLVIRDLVGYQSLIVTPAWISWLGVGSAIAIGAIAAVIAALQINRLEVGDRLEPAL